MTYRLRPIRQNGDIMVVGCGGTGGFVAEGVARLVRGTRHTLRLVDHDRVEAGNLCRQNFFKADLGRFKAQALAERLAAAYGVSVEYAVCPIAELPLSHRGYITIGCVDNPAARECLQWAGSQAFGGKISYHCSGSGVEGGCWYIDAGNSEHSGQVLIGNCLIRECGQGFRPNDGICDKLPLPTVQQPGLLAPEVKALRRRADCAGRVAANEQSPVINQVMAGLVLAFVHKLLAGTLTWMAAYIDLDIGSARFVEADPGTVARVTGHSVRQLEYRPRKA